MFTGDTLLIGGTGRTDLPTGNARELYDSLFHKLLLLDPGTRVHPAHIYSERQFSTIGEEMDNNKRLQVNDPVKFVAMMSTRCRFAQQTGFGLRWFVNDQLLDRAPRPTQ